MRIHAYRRCGESGGKHQIGGFPTNSRECNQLFKRSRDFACEALNELTSHLPQMLRLGLVEADRKHKMRDFNFRRRGKLTRGVDAIKQTSRRFHRNRVLGAGGENRRDERAEGGSPGADLQRMPRIAFLQERQLLQDGLLLRQSHKRIIAAANRAVLECWEMAAAPGSLRLIRFPDGASELARTTFAVVDLETTGGRADEEGITEIAAFATSGGRIVNHYHQLVNPEKPIPPFIVGLTGITNEMVGDAPTIAEVLVEFLDFLGDAVVVAHHAEFDMSFLEIACEQHLHQQMDNGVLCTRRLGKRLLPWLPSYSLDTIANFLGLKIRYRHRAFGDAYATTQLLNFYLAYLEHMGVHTLEQLFMFQAGKIRLS